MRQRNKHDPIRSMIVLSFTPDEFGHLKRRYKSAAGNLGGWPRLENKLLDLTDPETLICTLGPEPFMQLICYLTRSYGGGGPNKDVSTACIPALRRAGIDVTSNTERGEDEIQSAA